jgi:hypothetical protein
LAISSTKTNGKKNQKRPRKLPYEMGEMRLTWNEAKDRDDSRLLVEASCSSRRSRGKEENNYAR